MIVVCIDNSGSVAADDFEAVREGLARAVERLGAASPRPELDIVLLEVTERADSVRVAPQTVLPSVGAEPPKPEPDARRPATPLVVDDEPSTFDAARRTHLAWSAEIESSAVAAAELAESIRQLPYLGSMGTDLWGCITRADQLLLSTAREIRVLVVASDFLADGDAPQLNGQAHVVLVPECSTGSPPDACAVNRREMSQWFGAHGWTLTLQDPARMDLVAALGGVGR